MSDYSRLLTKMSELKAIEGEYNTLSTTYQPAISVTTISTTTSDTVTARDKYIITPDKNAISNTKTPLVIRPGEDYGEFWKYVGKVDNPVASGSTNAQQINSQKCWNMTANDPRLFKKVVYTGVEKTNPGQPDWDNRCYALTPDAPANASYDTTATGYSIMEGNGDGGTNKTNDIYTKLGIYAGSSSAIASVKKPIIDNNVAKASKLNDLQMRVNSLTQDIVASSDAGINNELNTLVASAAGSNDLVGKINQYMNSEVGDISGNYYLMDKRKELNNVYAEINEQTTLRGRKYRFIFYIVVTLFLIIGYASYTSKMSIFEQIDTIKNYLGWGWWTNWWIIAIVVILLILSSFGWDMKGNILMVIRYVTDPDFWTGQLWWVGVTFLLLIIIFFYATFKSFFTEFDAGMKSIQSNLDGGDSE
jgi:hypothetical protein